MFNKEFYAQKPFEMTEYAEGLIKPFGVLYCADRDFLTFELSFFYYYIHDYKIYSYFNSDQRRKILDTFLEKIQIDRSDDFSDIEELNDFYEKRIFSFFTMMKDIKTIGEFTEKCSKYISTILSYSEKHNAFTCHTFDQAEKELSIDIEADKYVEELTVLLTLTSAPFLTDEAKTLN